MCGIVADLRGPIPEAAKLVIDRRGTRSKQVGPIYHRRLPIVGVGPSNDQPMARGKWTVAFVGEVLDFREDDPTRDCDASLVADIWEKVGPHGMVGHDGFWHIVAYDHHLDLLHLQCDYLGQKPLYYRTDFGACASEPAACALLAPTPLDETYLSAVVKWGYCPEPWRTPFLSVRRVMPGEHVVLSTSGFVCKDLIDPLRPRAWVLRDEIEAAVRRRVQSSDVPVACLLSGGLDSSITYTLSRQYGTVRPYYVCVDGDEDERRMVELVARDPVQEVKFDQPPLVDALGIMQEPIDLGSLLPQISLAAAISETVCLTGDGADELFGGYRRSLEYDSQWSDIFHELVCWHLPRLDRVMMNNLVEVRSPFLARRVVEAALALPRDLRTGKKILREMFLGVLPDEVIYQRKKPLRVDRADATGYRTKLVNTFRGMNS